MKKKTTKRSANNLPLKTGDRVIIESWAGTTLYSTAPRTVWRIHKKGKYNSVLVTGIESRVIQNDVLQAASKPQIAAWSEYQKMSKEIKK